MIGKHLHDLAENNRGVTALEFGLIAPVFISLMLGIFDLGQMVYGQSILNGAVQEVARSGALEGADTDAADSRVETLVTRVLPGAEITGSRISYFDFADIGRPEQWNDGNDNGTCDDNESYLDENGSGSWEADIGVSGNGGAGDVIIYSVEVAYEPLFPLFFALENWSEVTLSSSTVRKNQPFSDQNEYKTTAGICA
jgi:Flp pilus assembly pilin Flp